MNRFLLIVFLLLSQNVIAETLLNTKIKSLKLESTTNLGKVNIKGLGNVQLTAERKGHQVLVRVLDSAGTLLGRAETVMGVKETPIYVRVSGELEKIIIVWASLENEVEQ